MGDSDKESNNLMKLTKNELIEKINLNMNEARNKKIQIVHFAGVNDDMDACDWIEMYEILSDEAKWPDRLKIVHLPSYLRGIAVKWYFNCIKGHVILWDEIKSLFISQFGYTNKPSLASINNAKWDQEKETFAKYYQDKLAMCSRSGMKGALLLDALTDGLPDDLKFFVQTIDPSSSPQVWFNLVQRAIDRKTSRREQKKPKPELNVINEKSSEIQEMKNDIKEIKRLLMGLTSGFLQDTSSSQLNCNHCGKSNHSADRCFKIIGYPSRKAKQQVNTLKSTSDDEESIVELDEPAINRIEAKIKSGSFATTLNSLVFLPIKINDQVEVEALIDSGANITAIDHQFCVDNDIMVEDKITNLTGATNSFESSGVARLNIKCGEFNTNIDAIVIRLAKQKFILGMNEFKYFGIKLVGPNLQARNQSRQVPVINSLDLDSCEAKQQIDELVNKNSQAFGEHDFHVGNCKLIKCHIFVEKNAKPMSAKPRRLSLALQEEEKKQVQQLLGHKLIRPSFSSWASGITFAIRDGRTPRLCGDYRYLNKKTISDQYPIPNIENIILQFKGAKVYSTLDVVRGYNHIEIDSKDRYLTAFTTNIGLFEWNRMPFGLKNAPSIFQRLMDRVLKSHEAYAKAYFDDIIIFSKDVTSHLAHIESVFRTLIAFDIKLKRIKCQFLRESITFCGYLITRDKISRDSKFTEAIANIQRPSNVSELQSFLGLANYGGRFVANFADICKPLNSLRKKNTSWSWTQEHEESFNKLKKILCKAPKLFLFDNSLDTVLYCDASKFAIAGVLIQKKGEEVRIIGYFSRTLTNAQVNYNIYTKELLAIVKSVEFFKQLLYGRPFKVVTDNSALAFFKSSKQVFDKYTRWLLFLEDFDIEIEHVKGNKNALADAISRVKMQSPQVTAIEGQTRREFPEPESLNRIFNLFHTTLSNHSGFNKMKREIQKRYLIKQLDDKLRDYLSRCKACNLVNQHVRRMGFYHPRPPSLPNSTWHSDVLGPFPASNGFNNVLVIIDHTTRFAQSHLLSNMTAETLIQSFRKSFSAYGRPRILITDNGSAYRSDEFQRFLTDCEVEHKLTPSHYSAANGLAERFIKTLKEALIKFKLDNPTREWSTMVPLIVGRYNSTKHRVTGFSPRELMNYPALCLIANRRTCRQQLYDANRLNKRRKPAFIREGNNIYIDIPKRYQKRFAPRRSGPYKVIKKLNDEICITSKKLPCSGWQMSVHSKNMKVVPTEN